MDFDGNFVIDETDLNAFLAVYEGEPLDCDCDGLIDVAQVVLDPALDADGSGVLDVCEAMGDLNGDGIRGVDDLATILEQWGPCVGCPADLDDDGAVTVLDVLRMLGSWGSCR